MGPLLVRKFLTRSGLCTSLDQFCGEAQVVLKGRGSELWLLNLAFVSGQLTVATAAWLGAQHVPAFGSQTQIAPGSDQRSRPIYQLQNGAKSGR
jgi:hypothetical protein